MTMVSMSGVIGQGLLGESHSDGSAQVNVGTAERWASILGGGALALCGLRDGSVLGFGAAILGGSLVYRGLSGHCSMYKALGVDTSARSEGTSIPAGKGIKVVESITVNRRPEELFRFWRDLANLPRVMPHLVSVTNLGNKRSHWVARGPAGLSAEWDAEIHNEEANRLIAWRSVPGSRVDTAGSVHFEPAEGGRGTEVHVVLKYDPPAGTVGTWLTWLMGQDPQQQVQEDLRRFKQVMEGGEALASRAGATSRL